MTSVGSMAARSGLRAGSALTIGGGGNDLSKAIALLRSVGGRMYLPGLTSRVASDGSGGSPVAGDPIGWLPDRVSGEYGPELLTDGDFSNGATGWLPGPNWAVANGVASCDGSTTNYLQKANVFTANKTYRVEYQIVRIASGSIRARASTSSLGSPRTSAGVYVEYLTPNESGGILNFMPAAGTVASIDNISVREVIALTKATTGFKPKLIREPILGPELVVNGDFSNGTTGWNATQSTLANVGGELVLTANGVSYPSAKQTVPTVAGNVYRFTTSQRQGTSTLAITTDISGMAGTNKANGTATMAQYSRDFTALTSASIVSLVIGSPSAVVGSTAIFDNISVREILGYTERYSLEFDGADDHMAAYSAATLSDGLVMVWTGAKLDLIAQDRLLSLWDTATTTECAISATAAGVECRLRVPGYGELNVSGAALGIGSKAVVSLKITATTASLRINGGAWNSVAHGLVLPNTVLGLGLGARSSGTLPANCIMSASMVANLGANATDANIAILERAAAQAAGITL